MSQPHVEHATFHASVLYPLCKTGSLLSPKHQTYHVSPHDALGMYPMCSPDILFMQPALSKPADLCFDSFDLPSREPPLSIRFAGGQGPSLLSASSEEWVLVLLSDDLSLSRSSGSSPPLSSRADETKMKADNFACFEFAILFSCCMVGYQRSSSLIMHMCMRAPPANF